MRKHIPNLFTLGNLLCGSMATLAVASTNHLHPAVLLIFVAAFFDLLDGAVARALKVDGPLGKELDSLADVVSFGLAPTAIAFSMMSESPYGEYLFELALGQTLLPLSAFAIVLGAAYRLAKFNIDTTQSKEFKGLPSPAAGLFWASLAVVEFSSTEPIHWLSPSVVALLSGVVGLLMVSNIRMFSFKFSHFGWKGNELRYGFLMLIPVVIFFSGMVLNLYALTVPILLLLYATISTVRHFVIPKP
ncbi:MAG: CDP-diacylglycerol--serine O-phosphatidyltransferase [Flavobacteriales bacterium]